jgi:hypothetical protein
MPARRRSAFPNPFYVALLVASTLFVMTALAYWVGPMVVQQAERDPALATENPATPGLIGWLDTHAPLWLGVEFAAMLVLGVLAMATDHWFERTRKNARHGSKVP